MTTLCFLKRAVAQFQSLSLRRISSEKIKDPLPSTRYPNTFGNLGQEKSAVLLVEQQPEEDGDVERLEFIDGIQGKTRMATFKYSRLIKKLIDKKKLKEALDVLDDRMKVEKAYPDRYTYNLLISGCASQGYTKKAFQLFNQMKKRGIIVSGATYTSLMNACANSPFLEDGLSRAERLRELMKEKGHDPNERTYHAMIKAFGRCGDLEQAFSVVDEMLDRNKLVSNSTYNFLLQACAASKEAGFRHSLVVSKQCFCDMPAHLPSPDGSGVFNIHGSFDVVCPPAKKTSAMVWRKMLSQKIKPTIYSYNLLLRCARDCSVGDMETLQEDIQKMVPSPERINRQAVEGGQHTLNSELPTVPSMNLPYNAPSQEVVVPNLLLPDPRLGSYVSLRNIRQPWHRLELIGGSSGFLQTMDASRTSPDIKTFTLLLETLQPTKEAEEELIQSMKNAKVKLDLDFCNLLIKKRAMHFRFEDAKKVMRLIKERSFKPNIVTFGVLALTCTDFNDAQELIDSIESNGYRVNIEIMGALFLRSSQCFDLKMMRYILAKMRQEKVKPNKKFLNHINDFQFRVEKHLQKSAKGERKPGKIDKPGFKEEYEKLRDVFKKIVNSEIEDSDRLHPWDQFKQSKAVATNPL